MFEHHKYVDFAYIPDYFAEFDENCDEDWKKGDFLVED
jgi:hypothetical protein